LLPVKHQPPTSPGKAFYIDPCDEKREPQAVHIEFVEGRLCALFRNEDGDGYAVIPVGIMDGEWRRA
jgi:hypothetical protein